MECLGRKRVSVSVEAPRPGGHRPLAGTLLSQTEVALCGTPGCAGALARSPQGQRRGRWLIFGESVKLLTPRLAPRGGSTGDTALLAPTIRRKSENRPHPIFPVSWRARVLARQAWAVRMSATARIHYLSYLLFLFPVQRKKIRLRDNQLRYDATHRPNDRDAHDA